MKVWKIVSGILSIVLSFLILFQSCAALLGEALDSSFSGGGSGMIVFLLMMTGGIVSICLRNGDGLKGNLAIIIIYGLAAMIGIVGAGSYSDLVIWGVWCVICAVVAAVFAVVSTPKSNKQ